MSLKNLTRRKQDFSAGLLAIRPSLLCFIIVTGLSGLGYYVTICPTVEFIDSGELALACKNLGIAHPTGYPLYMALGRLASIIPWGELIAKMNMMSLLFTSFASGFLFLLTREFINLINLKCERIKMVTSVVALFMSFSPIWWAQGTTNEVYSLNLLLISISLWALFKHIGGEKKDLRWAILSSYLLGLSLANHLSAIYILPAYIYLVIYQWRQRQLHGKKILILGAFFLFPASLYLLLPIRAGFAPFLNWGGVDDFYFLYKHISGWQYRIWMFNDPNFGLSLLIDKISDTSLLLYRQVGWFGMITAVIGIIILFFKKTYLALLVCIIIFFNFIYASNYEIVDIESYYLPMIMMFSIFITIGTVFLVNSILKYNIRSGTLKFVATAALILIPLLNFTDNFFVSDRNNKTFARRGVNDMLRSMEPNSLAFIENWDFYSPWLYFRFEDSLRRDIILLDKELMRRSWYIDFIKRNHPGIYEHSKEYFEEFLRQVEPFEKSLPFNSDVIDKAYYGMLHGIVENETKRRSVYTNILNDRKFTSVLLLVPSGILFKVAATDTFMRTRDSAFDKAFWGNKFVHREQRIAALLSYYKNSFSARERYCRYFNQDEEADYYKKMTANVSAIISEIKNN